MRTLFTCLTVFAIFTSSVFGQVSINESGTPASPGSILDVSSATKGMLIPRTDTASIASPVDGMLIYDDSDDSFYYFSNSSNRWQKIAGKEISYVSGTPDSIFINGNLFIDHDVFIWDDLRVPVTSAKTGGVNVPGFDLINGLGGLRAYFFTDENNAQEKEMHFTAQLPHSYMPGTDIIAHVHWMPQSIMADGETVKWGLEYAWQNIGDTYSSSDSYGTVYGVEIASGSIGQNKHLMTNLTVIPGNVPDDKEESSMLICRIFRDSSEDTYTGAAILLEIDFHFRVEKLGEYFVPNP